MSNKRKLKIDKIFHILFSCISVLCGSIIVVIILFIFIKGIKPFIGNYPNGEKASIVKFLFGTEFLKGNYGILGIVLNTFVIVISALIIAVPISILTSLFIVRIAPKKLGTVVQNIVELLASIPSIIFGLFGMGVINKGIKNIANILNIQTAGGVSLLSVIIVVSLMIMPTVTMLATTSMRTIKEDLIWASLSLGATATQTNFKVIVKGAKSGIIAAVILGLGRALGEATAVSMVCGGAVGIAVNPFKPTSTITSTMLQGIYESSGLNYDIRFSLGIVLIILIITTNVLLNYVKKKVTKHEK